MVDERVADLQATVDYLADLTEQSDGFDMDAAIELADELGRVKAAAKKLDDMLRQQMLAQLEDGGPRQYGTRIFARAKDYKDRHDHERIVRAAIDAAMRKTIDPDTGEVNAREAAEAAARQMASFYVSPSTTAKVTPLKLIGVDKKEYQTREFTGWKLLVTETDPG